MMFKRGLTLKLQFKQTKERLLTSGVAVCLTVGINQFVNVRPLANIRLGLYAVNYKLNPRFNH